MYKRQTGYRPNAATAIAGFAVWEAVALWRCKAGRRWRAAGIGVLLLGTLLAFRVPHMAGVQPVSNGVVGPMWETACMLNRIGEGNGYDTYLDDLIGAGNTEKIFAVEEEPEDSMYLCIFSAIRWITGPFRGAGTAPTSSFPGM